jgi:hypothetical protein
MNVPLKEHNSNIISLLVYEKFKSFLIKLNLWISELLAGSEEIKYFIFLRKFTPGN